MTLPKRNKCWLVVIGFLAYFGALLVPKFVPGFYSPPIGFTLSLTLGLVVPSLIVFTVWGAAALVVSKIRKHSIGQRSRTAGLVGITGLTVFAISLLLTLLPPFQLPSGSYLNDFDRIVWLDPASADYIEGDITPRQKMLADVVDRLPGKNQTEIVNMLGAPIDTEYFRDTGRNLIYVTGPERDSFVSIDSEWLLIWVDEEGLYKRHAIVTD